MRNRAPSTVVARVSTVAPCLAPKAVWLLPPPPNALAISPPALLEEHHNQQEQADEDVYRDEQGMSIAPKYTADPIRPMPTWLPLSTTMVLTTKIPVIRSWPCGLRVS